MRKVGRRRTAQQARPLRVTAHGLVWPVSRVPAGSGHEFTVTRVRRTMCRTELGRALTLAIDLYKISLLNRLANERTYWLMLLLRQL